MTHDALAFRKVWRVGANIDTDALAPGAYMKHGIEVIAAHCLEVHRPDFASGVKPGDVLVAGPNFGIGSSREQAADAYNRLLAANSVQGKLKAQALLALGDIAMSRNEPKLAVPYYQRIYILYGKWRETVAQAYLRSGEAFEQLNDTEAARRTYEELANSEDLGSLPQAQTAREKLKKFTPKEQAPS
jgi:hypothetical protein